MKQPSKTDVDEELERIIKAPPVVIHKTYESYRAELYEKIDDRDWKQSDSTRAKFRRLLGGK